MRTFWALLLTGIVAAQPPVFVNVTAKSGVRFTHNSGRAGKKWLPETMGSGVLVLDADGDAWPDLLLLNAKDWSPRGRRGLSALYRNNRNGTFTNVTAGSGLDAERYAMGGAVADYDNDGREDIYITALGGGRLFHNEGNFKFRDVTASAGIKGIGFETSAAWLDADRDGKADLLVGNYVQWSAAKDLHCSLDGATKSYCTPESYPGAAPLFYKNLGGGKFEECAQRLGLGIATAKTLGVAVLDYNADGWPDLFLANDTQPNLLFRNDRRGGFREAGVASGVAFGEDGVARGAMGVDAADYDRSGKPHLLVGNFSNQMLGLYHNEGNGLFVDEAPRSAVGRASLLRLAFGVFFLDYDNDGWLDIFAANGHIDEEIQRVQPKVTFAQPPLLFRNKGRGVFEDITGYSGKDFAAPLVARGAAYADFDGDGDLDLALNNNHGPAVIYGNEGGNRRSWISIRLEGGPGTNRSALGAIVRIESPGGKQWRAVHSGSSYLSQSDLALHFGLGADETVDKLTVEWPDGKAQVFNAVKARRAYRLTQGGNTLNERMGRQ
jgi:enediyne biosynthesis protein E4